MGNNMIDLEILEQEGGNSFDIIMSHVEIVSLSEDIGDLKEKIERSILSIERKMQDLSDIDTIEAKTIVKKTFEILKFISPILKENSSNHSLEQISTYLITLDSLVRNSIDKTLDEINLIFWQLSPENLKQRFSSHGLVIPINTYTGVIYGAFNAALGTLSAGRLLATGSSLREFQGEGFWNIEMTSELKDSNLEPEVWDMEIEINDTKNQHKALYTIWLFVESLNKINGVNVEIEEIRKGSIFSKLKIYFSSPEAKKEAQELLESTKKAAKGKLEKDFQHNEKTKAEAEKFESEKNKIDNEIKQQNSEEAKRKRELEIQAMEIENERMRLENEKLKLQVFLEKKKALSELLAEELISHEEFKLKLNQMMYISKKDDQIEVSESFPLIE